MKHLHTPFLPTDAVSLFVADNRCGIYLEGKYNYIPSFSCQNIMPQIASHPDMTLCYLGKKTVVVEKSSYNYYSSVLTPYGFNVIEGKSELNYKYPYDIAFNCVILSGMLFHKLEYTEPKILNIAEKMGLKLVNVRQGYTKCSTLIIDEKTVITGDPGLHKTYSEHGIESLLISNESIVLDGFDNGFIGGAGGLLAPGKLAMFGDIKTHPQYTNINELLERKNISVLTLLEGNLYDYGSIIPLKESNFDTDCKRIP